MTISCHRLSGDFTRELVVTTNDPEHITEKLVCKGRILEPFKTSDRGVNFGMVSGKGGAQEKTLEITRGDGGPLKPKLLPVAMKNLRAELEEVEPGERYKLKATLTPPFETTRVASNLEIETGVSEAPIVKIPVYMRVAPKVMAQPRALRLPAELKEDWQRTIRVIWDDNESHEITGVESDAPDMNVELAEQDGEQVVNVRIAAAPELETRQRVVKIHTNDSESPLVTVSVIPSRRPLPDQGLRARVGGAGAGGETSQTGQRSDDESESGQGTKVQPFKRPLPKAVAD